MRADRTIGPTVEWTPLARQLSRQAPAVPCPERAATTLIAPQASVTVAGCLQIAIKIRPPVGCGAVNVLAGISSAACGFLCRLLVRFQREPCNWRIYGSEWPQGSPAVSPYRSRAGPAAKRFAQE
jgi:hypothetical protein